VNQRGGHAKRLRELRLDDLGGPTLCRAPLKLVGVAGRICLDRYGSDIVRAIDPNWARAANAASIAACSGRPHG
jgi:hypothetical protein